MVTVDKPFPSSTGYCFGHTPHRPRKRTCQQPHHDENMKDEVQTAMKQTPYCAHILGGKAPAVPYTSDTWLLECVLSMTTNHAARAVGTSQRSMATALLAESGAVGGADFQSPTWYAQRTTHEYYHKLPVQPTATSGLLSRFPLLYHKSYVVLLVFATIATATIHHL